MRILFTGASSFTGMWFVKSLAEAGNEVTAVFPRGFEEYKDLRRERMLSASKYCQTVFSAPFGSSAFLDAVHQQPQWDLLCHHAANVQDYKNPEFNFVSALSSNTNNLKSLLIALREKGCEQVLLTGSVFEQGEGEGSDLLRAFSPYGLSKGLTSEVFSYYCQTLNIKLGKFVIPNPFGPYEEPRFTTYLVKSWFAGETPIVSSPDYVRDNIPVSLLAKAYSQFSEDIRSSKDFIKFNPSFYVCKQGDFALHFAREMESRLHIPCKIEKQEQKEFPEPLVRVNTQRLNGQAFDWNETKAWDELAEYYTGMFIGAPF